MNVQPLSGGLDIEAYGSKAMQMQKGVCDVANKNMFHENDVAYLEGVTPDGETVAGENANYRIDAVLVQNKVVAVYFEKRAGD